MLGVLPYVSHSLVRRTTYIVGRLVYAVEFLAQGETVTTTNDRRQSWTRLHSLTSPNCERPVTPHQGGRLIGEVEYAHHSSVRDHAGKIAKKVVTAMITGRALVYKANFIEEIQ